MPHPTQPTPYHRTRPGPPGRTPARTRCATTAPPTTTRGRTGGRLSASSCALSAQADGPRWDHRFIKHEHGLVLALVANPPQWGDRAFPCCKEYQDSTSNLAVRDGDIFVRIPGKTRLATSNDLARLNFHRPRAPHTGAKVDVESGATFDRDDTESIREPVEGDIDRRSDSPLSDLGPSRASGFQAPALQAASWKPDSRSKERFRADVEEWQQTDSKAFIEPVST